MLLLLPTLLLLPLSHATTTTPTVILAATTVIETAITTVSASTTPLSPQYTSPPQFQSSMLNSTNFYRYEHSAPFLTWNTTLATYASQYASKCIWSHSHGPYGENLAEGYPDTTSAVDAWGNERAQYDFSGSQTGFSEATGHFTQLVWKGTTSTGCAAVDCAGKNGVDGVLVVCEYWPAGNVVGSGNQWFVQNVASQSSNGQGFNETAAADGVGGLNGNGTTTATGATATATASSAAIEKGRQDVWTLVVLGAALVFGCGLS